MLLRGELEGNQSAADVGRWVPARSGLVGIIPSHLSLGQADNPFRFAETLSRVFIAANRRNMPTRGLPRCERQREKERIREQIKEIRSSASSRLLVFSSSYIYVCTTSPGE